MRGRAARRRVRAADAIYLWPKRPDYVPYYNPWYGDPFWWGGPYWGPYWGGGYWGGGVIVRPHASVSAPPLNPAG